MKKEQKMRQAFERLKKRYPKVKNGLKNVKARNLFHHEVIIRKLIRDVKGFQYQHISGYEQLLANYVSVLDEVSEKLLSQYNTRNQTDYLFTDIISSDYNGYLKSGILSVLITSHIPKMMSVEFQRYLPENPSEEYRETRRNKRKFFLHLGDTNTGKTYEALQRLKQSEQGVYLAPLRILALENYERLNNEGVLCNLLTGEEEILIQDAKHSSCTVEKLDISKRYQVAVIDEVQLLADMQRGDAWTKAILGIQCAEIHLCGAALAKQQLIQMIEDCGDEYEFKEYTRLVPLEVEEKPVKIKEVKKGDALVAFSKRSVLTYAEYYRRIGILSSVIYGDLPPEVRREQYELFVNGTHPILIATDAIGMGINLPIERLIFSEISKFDGEEVRLLTSQEVKQIAGRAGRIGIYPVGYVSCLEDNNMDFIYQQLNAKDERIEQAVIGPSESILQIGLLPLQEKLALWSNEAVTLSYYRKKDISNYLLILDLLKEYQLPEKLQWKLMQVPFDTGNPVLLAQFTDYMNTSFRAKCTELEKPQVACQTSAEYEVYYQRVNLYYSCSKALGFSYDEEWIMNTRSKISKQIAKILRKQNVKKEK